MIDIAGFDTARKSTEGVRMVICRPDSTVPILDADKNPAAIILRGRNSPQYRAVQAEIREEQARRRTFGSTEQSAEEEQQDRIRYLVALTVGFENLEMNGKPLGATKEELHQFWGDMRHEWIHRQAERFILSDDRFLALGSAA